MKKIILYMSLIILYLPLFSQNAEIDSLVNLLENHTKTDTAKIDLLNDIAFKMRFYDLKQTLQYSTLADSLSDFIDYKKGKAKSLKIQGVYYKIKENYPKSLTSYEQSINISREIDDHTTMAACYNNIGNIYKANGNYPLSLDNYQKSLSLFDKIGNRHHAAVCQLNIAGLYGFMGKMNEELPYYLKLAKYFSEIQDYRYLILVYQNIVNLYRGIDNDSLAIHYSKKLIPICESVDDNDGLSLAYIQYGLSEENFGNNHSAEQKFLKAISISEKNNFMRGMIGSYHSIAKYYYHQSFYNLALKYALKAQKIADKTDRLEEKSKVAELLSFIYEKTNNFKEAYKHHVFFKNMSDSMYNTSNIKEITTLENKYKFEKEKKSLAVEQAKKDALKQAEIEHQKSMLNVKNKQVFWLNIAIIIMSFIFSVLVVGAFYIRKQNKKIRQQAEEIGEQYKNLEKLDKFKKLLTQTFVHDLKNPLSQIINNTSEKALQFPARKMLRLISNMLDVEKYENTEFKLIKESHSLRKILDESVAGQKFSLMEKNLEINLLFNNFDVVADKDVLSRVFDNLFSNAIRYSPQNSHIDVTAKKSGDHHVEIGIKNFGKQISEMALPDIFKKYRENADEASSSHRSTGLGLAFCKMAIEAHGQSITAQNEKDGVLFSFSLPGKLQSGQEQVSVKSSNKVNLTIEEKDFLKPYFENLNKIDIHELSDIHEVLSKIPEKTKNITELKQQIKDSAFTANEELFRQLLTL